ncbi:hypothetical protein EV383_0485 [Pseudonocardia sediminis]|uniref:Polyketide cyclase/dehydrase/lipid transport protein n=1 Tax=Pseudonocardia sediminis TaxID=1397368 RepID=A0A4Q7UUH0_PSEST|nr:SRPBCC family protein [Pseudonocardia sediminis]RZT83673.1 hypothetical protein EV383_0485 [Pseudonocardia sediminis]
MGIISTASETAFTESPEAIYDVVTDPRNWPKAYPGSGAIEGVDTLPLQVGDTWSESGVLGDLPVRYTWRLITAVRPTKWVFQSIDLLAQNHDGTGGFPGVTTIAYTFSSPGSGVTLFHRSMTTEVSKHAAIPDQVVLAHQPGAIDAYHDAIGKLLQQ